MQGYFLLMLSPTTASFPVSAAIDRYEPQAVSYPQKLWITLWATGF